ncbi:asparagine synthase (glutamine-hydrolyzing) [Streptomyces nojiriensis]|uniref:asparagine synthase (glutamine-hydrolyzing) n=1 Tax=Streptomyces nojiriensis TaxID=66374 RepID=UPI0035D69C45
MCGIAGCVSLESSGEGLERDVLSLLQLQQHRGPDELSLSRVADGVVLGCTRLAIVDPDGAKQPISSSCAPIQGVCNGEIYNAPDLRKKATEQGHRLQGLGDCEPVLHLYEDDPDGFAERLDGMFAFALWDGIRKRLVLGRDRLGVKPLYYRICDGKFYFASEAPALARIGRAAGISSEGAAQFISLRFVKTGSSMFEGIHELAPGSVLIYENGTCSVRRYWYPRPAKRNRDVLQALENAVGSCASTANSPGVLLSGGLDSTSVLGLLASSTATPRSFSVGYDLDEGQSLRRQDERVYAAQAAAALGSVHQEAVLNDAEIAAALRATMTHLSEPIFSQTAVSTWAIARLASQYGKDVLTGDGADELFLGYDYFTKIAPVARRAERTWRTDYLDAIGWLAEPWRSSLVDPAQFDHTRQALFETVPQDIPPLDQIRLIELTQRLPNYQLTRVDRLTMAHGLEARVPFLTNSVVDASLSFTTEELLADRRRKQPLLDAVRGRVPAEIWERPKMKFSAPASTWLRLPALRELTRELLLGSGYHALLGVRKSGLASLLAEMDTDTDKVSMPVWGMLTLFLWADVHSAR